MAVKCADVIKVMEKIAHPKHAEGWDNVGLQIGSPDSQVEKVLVTLDVNLAVVEEAKKHGVDLLVVHHTPMFKPVPQIRWDRPQGKIIQELIKNNINLYCAHTNLDSSPWGVNEVLAKKFELQEVEVLSPNWQEDFLKLAVFVPIGYEDKVRSALGKAGAGWIGNYSDCTFQVKGTGTFRPLEGTNPFIGEKDKLEKVDEYRLETIIPREKLNQVLEALFQAHPYEEVAYDLYPLANKGQSTGLGRVGLLPEEITFQELIEKVADILQINSLRYVGDLNSRVKKVALCGGSGASLITLALKHGAHVYITGDIKYHEAQEAESLGLKLIDAGHFATEQPVIQVVADFLKENLPEINVFTSQINTDPFMFFKR